MFGGWCSFALGKCLGSVVVASDSLVAMVACCFCCFLEFCLRFSCDLVFGGCAVLLLGCADVVLPDLLVLRVWVYYSWLL